MEKRTTESAAADQYRKLIEESPSGLTIKRMTAQRRELMEMPGVVNGFIAIVMAQGTARAEINGAQYDLERSNVIFLKPKDEIYATECSDDTVAYMIISSGDFMNSIQVNFSTSFAINMRHGQNPILKISEADTSNFIQIVEIIHSIEMSDKKQHVEEIIGSLFTSIFYLLTDIEQDVKIVEGKRKKNGSGEAIFNKFVELLNKYNKRERNVQFYATQLGISTKYLSVVVKNISGKTAARWIDESVILEAKALLAYSGMSINEIAQELNFTTQSFFGKYFKQHTGVSPSRFKRKR